MSLQIHVTGVIFISSFSLCTVINLCYNPAVKIFNTKTANLNTAKLRGTDCSHNLHPAPVYTCTDSVIQFNDHKPFEPWKSTSLGKREGLCDKTQTLPHSVEVRRLVNEAMQEEKETTQPPL